MAKPSQLALARAANDRRERTHTMASIMHDRHVADGACKTEHLRAAGFTEAEIRAYSDDARAILSGRAGQNAPPAGRVEGKALVRAARRIRKQREAAHG